MSLDDEVNAIKSPTCAVMSLDDEVNAIKSPTCQPPSRIKTWKRNICSDGRSNQIKCGWIHHLLYTNGFGGVAGRVSSSLVDVKDTYTSLPCRS